MSTVSEEEMKAHERLTQWADVYAKLSPDGEEETFMADLRLLLSRPSLPSGDGWRPIESAPRDKTMVALLHAGTMGGRPFWRYGVGWWMPLDGWQGWFLDVGGDRRAPTHWMPLPSAPSGEG